MEQKKKKHPHDGHRQRMKQKAIAGGIEAWPYHEVLELLLMYGVPRRDVNPLAHELIEYFGSFAGVLDAGYDQLSQFKGLGKEAAKLLALLPDIFSKYTASKCTNNIMMESIHDCVAYFKEITRIKDTEDFYVFCLDNKKKLMKTIHFDGGLAASISFPLNSFVKQLSGGTTKSLVVMHTHPGNNSEPTKADVEATRKIVNVCIMMGIKFEDHIIVSNTNYYSFAHSGKYDMMFNEASQSGLYAPLMLERLKPGSKK